jgi:hypothetical protein
MWYVALTQDHSQFACGVVGAVFMVLGIILAVSLIRTSRLIGLKYRISKGLIKNIITGREVCIDLNSQLFCSKVILTFYLGKGCVKKEFLIFSNKSFPVCIQDMEGGTTAVKCILEAESAILPICFSDRDGVLHQRLNTINIPQMPHIVYIPEPNP